MTINQQRVLVIGLDCAAPRFVFGPDAFDLPNIRALMERGRYGPLESCHPPITVPAWACMTTGKDPGELGCYGFRNRIDHSYREMVTANGASIKEPRIWDMLSRNGKHCIVLGVPQTYPPKPLNGCLVSGMDAPDSECDHTYPKSLKREIEWTCGGYIPDVRDFRTDDKTGLLLRIYEHMQNRFAIASYLVKSKPWDFFMMVETGLDRLHHGFWKYCDPSYPKFEPGNPFQHAFREYYSALDARIGDLLALAGENVTTIVVSDHGAKAMRGGLRINQWLFDNDYLRLKDRVARGTRIEDCPFDWPNTRAWSSGGYYARVFLNVEGREPQGCVRREHYERVRNEIAEGLRAINGPNGETLQNIVLKPEEIYRKTNGIAPDLIVYPDDLNWRAIGTLGHDSIYADENDTGPDDANHDYNGIFIMDNDGSCAANALPRNILDVAPLVLSLFGVSAG